MATSPPESDRLQTWTERWNTGSTAFHRADVHHALHTHLADLLTAGRAVRALVPLCGKTIDMPFLASQDPASVSQVVGVEGVRKGVEQLVEESPDMAFDSTGDVAVSGDGRLKVYVADFFQLPEIGQFEAAWDRGSFVAIDEDVRQEYADVMSRLMLPGGKILLDVFCYNQAEMEGPPFSIDLGMIEKYFGSTFAIQQLQSSDAFVHHKNFVGILSSCKENVYLLTRK